MVAFGIWAQVSVPLALVGIGLHHSWGTRQPPPTATSANLLLGLLNM